MDADFPKCCFKLNTHTKSHTYKIGVKGCSKNAHPIAQFLLWKNPFSGYGTSKYNKYTRAKRKVSTIEQHKSAITDHVAQEITTLSNGMRPKFWIGTQTHSQEEWEAIEIFNRDEGSFTLDHVYDSLLCTTLHPRKKNYNKFPGKSSQPIHL